MEKNQCETNQCGCTSVSLPCTDLCSCKNCKNLDDALVDIEDMFDDDEFFDNSSDDNYDSSEPLEAEGIFGG